MWSAVYPRSCAGQISRKGDDTAVGSGVNETGVGCPGVELPPPVTTTSMAVRVTAWGCVGHDLPRRSKEASGFSQSLVEFQRSFSEKMVACATCHPIHSAIRRTFARFSVRLRWNSTKLCENPLACYAAAPSINGVGGIGKLQGRLPCPKGAIPLSHG